MHLGAALDVQAVGETRSGYREIVHDPPRLDHVGEGAVQSYARDRGGIASAVRAHQDGAVEGLGSGVHGRGRLRSQTLRRAVALNQGQVMLVAARTIGGDHAATVRQGRRAETRAVMAEDQGRRTSVQREGMEVEEPLVAQVGERQDAAAVRGPVDDVMDPVATVAETPRIGPVGAHDRERPALVAAFVHSVGDVAAVARNPVRADSVAVIAEAHRHASGHRNAPQLHRAGEVAHVEERPPIGGEREPRRATRVEDPRQ